jgi:hypothetical protein
MLFDQSDKIGRIFACWAIVYLGSLLINAEVAGIFRLLFPTVKVPS